MGGGGGKPRRGSDPPPSLCPPSRHNRAYLHALIRSETAALHHLTIHNIAYQVGLGVPGGP